MLIQLTEVSGKKVAINLTKAKTIESYMSGSKIVYYQNNGDSYQAYNVKETIEEICKIANETASKIEGSITIWHKNSSF
jgi:hypothetical protein